MDLSSFVFEDLGFLVIPALAVAGLLGAGQLARVMVASALRGAGLGRQPEDKEGVDWAGLLGLAAGAWVLLGGAGALSVVGRAEGVLEALAELLAALTAAGVILAGSDAYRRRAATRREDPALLRRVELAGLALAGLALASLAAPLVLVLAAGAGAWLYFVPEARSSLAALLPVPLPEPTAPVDPRREAEAARAPSSVPEHML